MPLFYDHWHIFLSTESGCEDNWEKNEEIGSCYQFNIQATLSWKEAYVSCQNQGADLLSINSAAELTYLKGRFKERGYMYTYGWFMLSFDRK